MMPDNLGFDFPSETWPSSDSPSSFFDVVGVGPFSGGFTAASSRVDRDIEVDEETGVTIGDPRRLKIEFDTGDTLIKSLARSAYLLFFSFGLLWGAWKGDDFT